MLRYIIKEKNKIDKGETSESASNFVDRVVSHGWKVGVIREDDNQRIELFIGGANESAGYRFGISEFKDFIKEVQNYFGLVDETDNKDKDGKKKLEVSLAD